MTDGPGLFDDPTHRVATGADVSSLGKLTAIVVTESDAHFTFERGVLKTSPEQFFDISIHLSRKLETHG